MADYLGEVATMIADLASVYRHNQRGSGESGGRAALERGHSASARSPREDGAERSPQAACAVTRTPAASRGQAAAAGA
ncbi:hypothetical protein [Streptomyces jeddahensis]|uniref:hypothetical protein n=1 Tax=Streptomyces jeddahensis TaxID=1716141 RepID=UPI0018E31733|nr:hypothetical protein [Streptomyces jeddahensis]